MSQSLTLVSYNVNCMSAHSQEEKSREEKAIESLEKGISIMHLFNALSFGSLVREMLLRILLRNSQSTQNREDNMQSSILLTLPKKYLS